MREDEHAAQFPAATLDGLDYSETACAFATRKTGATIQRGSVNEAITIERGLIGAGLRLPFGGSVLAVASKVN